MKKWSLFLISVLMLLHHGRSGPMPAFNLIGEQLSSRMTESVYTNEDTLLDDEDVSDFKSVPLKNIPEFMALSKDIGKQGRTREARQTSSSLLKDYEDHLLFANQRYIVTSQKNGTVERVLQFLGIPNVVAIDYDLREGYIFWSDVRAQYIGRAKLDGTEAEILVNTNITVPDGIAWDWVNKKLYWTDAAERDIEVLDPATGERSVIIQSTGDVGESIPRAIELDPFAEKIYWTDWGSRPRIECVSYDGSKREVLFNTGLGWPNGLALDLNTRTLYWADGLYDRIESSTMDGLNRTTLIGVFVFHPFDIEICDGSLFWTDWQLNTVFESNRINDVDQISAFIRVLFNRLDNRPMGIKCISSPRQPLTNPVPIEKSVCDCLNGGTCVPGTSTCICDEDWKGKRCEEYSKKPNIVGTTCIPPCQNGGSCVHSRQCVCTTGYTGRSCEKLQDDILSPGGPGDSAAAKD